MSKKAKSTQPASQQLSLGVAITDPDAHRKELARKPRKCLSCLNTFDSDGPGNRICRKCKDTGPFRSLPADFSINAAAF